jgi:hypothetical protein
VESGLIIKDGRVMAAEYQLLNNTDSVLRVLDQAYIPNAGGNRDWQEYQAWFAEGNVPDPAPAPPEPPPPEPLELDAHPVGDMDAATKGYVDGAIAAALKGAR